MKNKDKEKPKIPQKPSIPQKPIPQPLRLPQRNDNPLPNKARESDQRPIRPTKK